METGANVLGKEKSGVPLELSIDSLKGDFYLHLNESVVSRIRGHSGHIHPKIVEVSHTDPMPTTGAYHSCSGMRIEEN